MYNLLNDPTLLPEADNEFVKSFDAFLDKCEFIEEDKIGILFSMGFLLPSLIDFDKNSLANWKNQIGILSLYSKWSGNISDYTRLNYSIARNLFYSVNHVIAYLAKDPNTIDFYFRNNLDDKRSVWQGELDNQIINEYIGRDFKMRTLHELANDLFFYIGFNIQYVGYSYSQAYEAGFVFRMHMESLDGPGTNFIATRILKILSPLYFALFYSPILFKTDRRAFEANHLFSLILNSLYMGSSSHLAPVAIPIHEYHQALFYKPGTNKFWERCLFNNKSDTNYSPAIVRYAAAFRSYEVKGFKELVIQLNAAHFTDILDKVICINRFIPVINSLIEDKYGLNSHADLSFDSDRNSWSKNWNNKGEYLQYLVILFYETCLHSKLLEKLPTDIYSGIQLRFS